jgi:hypothetical protein
MNNVCIIKQPAGLGDILFTSKIRKIFTDYGINVINPVISEYSWLGEYVDGNFPVLNNEFKYFDLYNSFNEHLPKTINHDNEKILIIPLESADRLFSGSVMDAKYKLLNIDFNDWSKFLSFRRNIEKENKLFYEILNLKDDDEFILINENKGSPPNHSKVNIKTKDDIKRVYMSFYDGFSLFDWIKVIEKSKELHFVESSLNFILEVSDINPKKIFVYSKHNPSSFNQVKHLFLKDWTFIY